MTLINETELKNGIGKLIAKRRKALKLSQEELAEKLEIKVRTLSKLENGHAFLSAKTLCKLCDFFQVSPKSFFDFENDIDNDKLKLNDIVEKLNSGGPEKINFYYDLINFVDSKYHG